MRKKNKLHKSTIILLLLLPITAILAKIYQYTALDANAFGIIVRIITYLRINQIPNDPTYVLPIKFYRFFSFLPFQTPLAWSIFWTVVMNVIFFVFLMRQNKKFTKEEMLFIVISFFILDVFVFNINKDLVQCLIFLVIYLVSKLKIKNTKKLFIIEAIIVWESTCFRPYYILGAATIFISYIVLSRLTKEQKEKKIRNQVAKASILTLMLLFTFVFLSQYISKEAYGELVSRRDTVVEDVGANTVIDNAIKGNSFPIFCINYLIPQN